MNKHTMEICRLAWRIIALDNDAMVYVWRKSLIVYAPDYGLNSVVWVTP